MSKILIADENRRRAAFLASILAPQTRCAAAAREAMELMRKEEYPLSSFSVSLPDMDGFELYEWLRLDPLSKSSRVLFVLDRSDRQTESACMRLGAGGVLFGTPRQMSAQLRRMGIPLRPHNC